MFEAVVPEDDLAAAVDDGHTVTDGLDDLPAAALFFEPADMCGVGAVREIQRHSRHQHDGPVPATDRLDEPHREAGSDAIVRTALEKTLQPGSFDRLSRAERHDDVRHAGPDEAVRDNGGRDWNRLSRPCEIPRRAAECPMCQARCQRRREGGCSVQEHSADGMGTI